MAEQNDLVIVVRCPIGLKEFAGLLDACSKVDPKAQVQVSPMKRTVSVDAWLVEVGPA